MNATLIQDLTYQLHRIADAQERIADALERSERHADRQSEATVLLSDTIDNATKRGGAFNR